LTIVSKEKLDTNFLIYGINKIILIDGNRGTDIQKIISITNHTIIGISCLTEKYITI